MQFFGKTDIDFVGKRSLMAILSIVIILGGIIVTAVVGPDFSIDFLGGTEIGIEMKTDQKLTTEEIKENIEKSADIDFANVKTYGAFNQFLINVEEINIEGSELSNDAVPAVFAALDAAYPGIERDVLKVDTIGPKIGDEMKQSAGIAIILAVVFILLYIAFRFEFVYGLGAVIALIHDVVLTFTMIVVLNAAGIINVQIDATILAAMLMVLGYSINDTVVIFDRIRENLERHQGHSYMQIINQSINESLSRTVNTSLSSLLVMLSLAILGGPDLFGLAMTMIVGLIAGTYSSIYIASSFVIWYQEKVKKIDTPTKPSKGKKLRTA